MITKDVSINVPAINKTAIFADILDVRGGVYTYDLRDANGVVAKSRYSTPDVAPFILTNFEIDLILTEQTEQG